jgi:hypothetical protein
LIAEEIGAVQEMVTKGLNPKPKLLALQRQAAEIEGMRGQNIAKIAEAKQQQSEAQLRVIDLKAQMLADAVTKLRDEQTKINDLLSLGGKYAYTGKLAEAVAYLRTSSATNTGPDRDSERRQREAIQTFAKRAGFTLVGEFSDPGVSGADAIAERPGFGQLFEPSGAAVRVGSRCRPKP